MLAADILHKGPRHPLPVVQSVADDPGKGSVLRRAAAEVEWSAAGGVAAEPQGPPVLVSGRLQAYCRHSFDLRCPTDSGNCVVQPRLKPNIARMPLLSNQTWCENFGIIIMVKKWFQVN